MTRDRMAQDLAAFGADLVGIMHAGRWDTPSMVALYIQDVAAHRTTAARYLKDQHPAPPLPTILSDEQSQG